MNYKTIYTTILLFILIILSNLYLLRSGFWFFQDASYWAKNSREAFILFNQQIHVFTNYGYYLGYDLGLFSFTRISNVFVSSLLVTVFGMNISQILYSLLGYMLTFTSFYLFSELFLSDNKRRFALTLFYTFSPLAFSLQAAVFYLAAIPLFLYSFKKYFFSDDPKYLKYLLLNIISVSIWVSYIRFIQAFSIVIVPYVILMVLRYKRLEARKVIIFIVTYLALLSPILYSFIQQLVEKSSVAFHYGDILGKFVPPFQMTQVFNQFNAIAPLLYENNLFKLSGLIFFIFFLLILITKKEKADIFYLLNLVLVFLGMAFLGFGNFVAPDLYARVVRIFPFITNQPYFAWYIIWFPFVVLVSVVRFSKLLYFYILFSIFIALIPLLNLSDVNLKKYDLSRVPKAYNKYFNNTYTGIPEATYYLSKPCWRAEYMKDMSTLCTNFGLHFASILLDDPRLSSGDSYELAKEMKNTANVDNLRITHNLKHIIVPRDMIPVVDSKKAADYSDIEEIKRAELKIAGNVDLDKISNPNFNDYFYKDKDKYDFFIYSPNNLKILKGVEDLFKQKIDLWENPVYLRNSDIGFALKSVKVFYKKSPTNPTAYLAKIYEPKSDFILQFNQSYSKNWKIKKISEKEFEAKKCTTSIKEYPITNNYFCQTADAIFSFWDILYLLKPNINLHHQVGNLLSNTFTISGNGSTEGKDMYLVIINEKQLYFQMFIIFSAFSLFLLILFVVLQQVLLSKYNKKQ